MRRAGIAPEFMPGLAILLAGGWWIHGMAAAALIPPILGALALVTFGGLAGRLIGPQWAPAAAAILGLSLPEQYTSRAAFLQPLEQILALGGLCLVVDSLTSPRGRAMLAGYADWLRWPDWLPPRTAAAALGGLALGMTTAVSLGALPFLIPIIPFLGVAVLARRPVVVPFGTGVLAGLVCGLAAGQLAAPGYRAAPGFAVRPMSLIAGVTALVTLACVLVALWPARAAPGPGGAARGRAVVAARGRGGAGGWSGGGVPDPARGADRALVARASHDGLHGRAAAAARLAGAADPVLRRRQHVLGHLVHRDPGAAARHVRRRAAHPAVRAAGCSAGRMTRTAPSGPGHCRWRCSAGAR